MFSEAKNIDNIVGMRAMESDSVDLTITSPPYDGLRNYNGFLFDYVAVFKELYRITKPGGVVVWIVNDQTVNGSETGTSFRQALCAMETGFRLHDTMIWKKDTSSFPDRKRYAQCFEYMFVFSKGTPKTFNRIEDRKNKWAGTNIHGTYRNTDGSVTSRSSKWKQTVCKEYGGRFNVWEIPTEKNNKTNHPAVFPLRLVEDHIKTWSNEGDLVLDPFLGSGTTRLAAWNLNRNFMGFEISKEYFDDMQNRWRGCEGRECDD